MERLKLAIFLILTDFWSILLPSHTNLWSPSCELISNLRAASLHSSYDAICNSDNLIISTSDQQPLWNRASAILLAEAKGVAGLGKAGGDSQGGSDKAGQQVPPEVYNALTYAGTAFLFTLSVPLILYGLNKLLNKIEDCFGCGPSSKKMKQQQKQQHKKQQPTRYKYNIYTIDPAQPNHACDQTNRQFQKNSSSKIVSMSSDDEEDQRSPDSRPHSQQRLHEQYSNHQSQLFTSAINGSIDIAANNLTAHPTTTTSSTLVPTATATNTSQLQQTNSCAITLPFETAPFAIDPLKKAVVSNNSNNDFNHNNDNDTKTPKPPTISSMENNLDSSRNQPQHGNNIAKFYQDASVNINNGFKSQPYIMSSSSPLQMYLIPQTRSLQR